MRWVEDPTTSPHSAITSEIKNAKKNVSHALHGNDKGSRIVHGEGSHVAKATSFDLRQRTVRSSMSRNHANFNVHVGSTRRDGNCSRRVAITEVSQNTNALSPRHTLISASIRRWLSMSSNQNRHSPLCNSVHLGTNRKHAAKTLSFSFGKVRIANLVSLKSHAVCHGKRNKVVFPHKFSNWVIVQRSCQIARVRKRQRDERSASGALTKCAIQCARRCQTVCHPVCQTLKKQHHSHHVWRTQR